MLSIKFKERINSKLKIYKYINEGWLKIMCLYIV